MNDKHGSGSIRAQVIALILLACLPIAWLIGRRTAPAPRPVPVLLRSGQQAIALRESPGGVAARGLVLSIGVPTGGRMVLRLKFRPVPAGADAHPPYRLHLEGPDGNEFWQGSWEEMPEAESSLELIVPRELLRSGRHALRVRDSRGVVRSFPFVVP